MHANIYNDRCLFFKLGKIIKQHGLNSPLGVQYDTMKSDILRLTLMKLTLPHSQRLGG